MALQPHGRNGRIARRNNPNLLNPDALRAAARLGAQLGRNLRDRYNEWQNNDPGDDDAELEPDDGTADIADIGPSEAPPPDNSQRAMGGSTSGIGYRGSLTGNTQLHIGYGAHYHEIQELHSKKIRSQHYVWGFKTKVSQADTTTPLYRPNNVNFNGIGLFNVNAIGENPFSNFSNTAEQDIVDYVYTHALNFILDDFIDNKLLSQNGQAGLMTQYLRFRLKSFTITITPTSFNGGLLTKIEPSALLGALQWPNTEPGISFFNAMQVNHTPYQKMSVDYWVLRDVYNDFTTTQEPFMIPARPAESVTPTLDNYSRAVRSVRNFDTYLTVMNSEKSFSFTREVATKANYYLTLSQIQALRNINVQVLINALEGLDGSGGIASALPESFNLLFGPTTGPITTLPGSIVYNGPTGQASGIPVDFNANTHLYIKTQATWEAFDFNYGTQQGPQSRGIDSNLGASIEAMTQRILQRHSATSCVQLEEIENKDIV